MENEQAAKEEKKDPCICQHCGHNMGRSRCKVRDGDWVVRCNKCKTTYTVSIVFPKDKEIGNESVDGGVVIPE